LEFVGRVDGQVKVRGFRVELGEVEGVVLGCPGVVGCVVVVREDGVGVGRLVAYVVGDVVVSVVRGWVVERLPGFMVPSVFVVLDAFPLTVNGKVDRAALPAPEEVRPELAEGFVEPRSEVEGVLAGVWGEVLRVDRVGVFDNFFELGGDSIRAMQIVARAAKHGITLTQTTILREQTVAGIAATLGDRDTTAASGESPAADRAAAARPLTPMQEGMLFHSLLETEEGAYIQQLVWRLPETTDWARLCAAWNAVVARHDILCTGFRWADGQSASQWAAAPAPVPSAIVDWTTTSYAAAQDELTAFLAADRATGFVLDRPPLMRLTRIDLADGVLLVWTHHHAIIDGWSIPVVLAEIVDEYHRQDEGTAAPAAPPQFGAFLDWLATRDVEAGRAYWRTRLAGFDGARSLGAIDLRPATDAPAATHHATTWLAPGTDAKLRALAREARVTLNTVVQGAWAVFLARWDARPEAVFGTVVAGRPEDVPDAQRLVGLCMNTVPMRVPVPDQSTIGAWLRRIQDIRLAGQEFDWMSLAEIQRIAGANREHPLFRTTVVYENFPDARYMGQGDGLFGSPARTEQHTADGVMLVVVPDPRLRLRLSVSETSLTDDDLADVLTGFVGLLERLAAAGTRDQVGSLHVLGDDATAAVLAHSTGAVVNRDHLPVHRWFARQARATPDAEALRHDGRRLTYRELDDRANRLANHLIGLGARQGTAVGICLLRGFDLVVALLGVLKAGAHYVPLEPGHPRNRSDYLLRDADVRILVTSGQITEHLPEFAGAVVLLDADGDPLAAVSPADPDVPVAGDELAYVIYTSGSTGKPKGVMIEHAALSNFVSWCLEGYAGDRPGGTAVFSSVAFDAVVPNIYPPLVSGRPVHLLPEPLDADALGDLLYAGAPYSFLKLTPSHFGVLAHQLGRDRARGLAHLLVVGAEAFPGSTLNEWRALDPDVTILNEYGPTEATVANSTYVTGVETDADLLPIGVPIPNTTMYILDADLRLCPPGVIGEIYIGGECVARGYNRLPGRTAESFLPDPFGAPGARLYRTGDLGRLLPDGNFDFRGRIDDQVKIRGYRIELAEIEGALLSHGRVEGAYVRVMPFASGPRIVAYIGGTDLPDTAELRAFLADLLPSYMHPAHVVALPEIPLTPHGKIDRNALPAPVVESGRDSANEPMTATEELVADVWVKVLGRHHVGLDDNFFELGGDSILSIRIVGLLVAQGVRTDLKSLFRGPTVRQLAQAADGAAGLGAPRRRRVSGDVPLSPVQQWFFDQNLADPHHYNQSMAFRITRRDVAAVRAGLKAVVEEHDAFRLRFTVTEDGSCRQRYEDFTLADDEWLQSVDLSRRVADAPQRAQAELTGVADKLQRGLDLHYGPLLRAAFVDLGEPDDVRLVIVAHHLVIDGVSWRILVADLETAAAAQSRQEPPAWGPRTSSFGDWAARLTEFAATPELRAQAGYWQGELADFQPLFTPPAGAHNLAKDARSRLGRLDAASTAALLREVPRQFGVRINGVLLTALSAAVRVVLGRDGFVVNLEGHGREPLFDDVDLTRTVGWFTSIFPVRLHAGTAGLAQLLPLVDARLRSVPDNGVGYGVLRYLSEEDMGLDRDVDVCFNYLGQFDGLTQPKGMLVATDDPSSGSVARGNRRAHRLEIVSSVTEGQLVTRWTFDPDVVTAATVAALAATYEAALGSLVVLGGQR
jgi:amino acid adenylation domain-containing protein/non-ribosomal peptide synthase protein (TIGR01720 family)